MPLEPGVVAVAVAVVAVVAVGHFPFTGSEPSGHGVVSPFLLLASLLRLLLLLLLTYLSPFLLLLDDVVSGLCFFFAKTVADSSDIKAIDAIDERKMKIVNKEIILEFCVVFVLSILIVLYFYFYTLFSSFLIVYNIIIHNISKMRGHFIHQGNIAGDRRCFEVIEKRTKDDNGMLKALRFHFEAY